MDGASSVNVGTPVIAGDRVIVAIAEGEVVQAFPLDCGGPRCEALWTGPVDAVLGNSLTPVVLNGVVFAPGQGGGATAFPVDCATECRPLWTDQGEGAPVPTNAGAVAVAGDRIVVAGGEGDSGTLEVFTLGGSPSPRCDVRQADDHDRRPRRRSRLSLRSSAWRFSGGGTARDGPSRTRARTAPPGRCRPRAARPRSP